MGPLYLNFRIYLKKNYIFQRKSFYFRMLSYIYRQSFFPRCMWENSQILSWYFIFIFFCYNVNVLKGNFWIKISFRFDTIPPCPRGVSFLSYYECSLSTTIKKIASNIFFQISFFGSLKSTDFDFRISFFSKFDEEDHNFTP